MKRLGSNAGLIAVFLTILMVVPTLSDIGSGFLPQDEALHASQGPLMSPSPYQNRSLSKGKFLVASRDMQDPRFAETVILLVEYSSNGATGLIVNRPTEVKLSSALPDVKGLEHKEYFVYIGGPVSQGQMLMLIQSKGKPEESQHVFQDIYVSGSQKVLEGMTGKTDTGKRFRVYAGYSGWGPGQLEGELRSEAWVVIKATRELVFRPDAAGAWEEAFARKGPLYQIILQTGFKPSMN